MAEGMNLYETVIVTSAKLGEEGSAELVNRFKALIEEHGTVEGVDDWGKRRFANVQMAAATIMLIPCVVLFFFFQKILINGVSVGAVKG